jgi:tetratricopeptide (TPR) repeat protein
LSLKRFEKVRFFRTFSSYIPLLLIGNILQDQDKIADAAFMYQRAIAVDPKFYKAYYNLGNIYLEDEKPYVVSLCPNCDSAEIEEGKYKLRGEE